MLNATNINKKTFTHAILGFLREVVYIIFHNILRPLLAHLLAWLIFLLLLWLILINAVLPHLGDIVLWIVQTGFSQIAHSVNVMPTHPVNGPVINWPKINLPSIGH